MNFSSRVPAWPERLGVAGYPSPGLGASGLGQADRGAA